MKLLNTIYIDESDFIMLKKLEKDDSLTFTNLYNKSFDENAFYDYLKNLEGADKLEVMSIGSSSDLKNVEVIKAFPNLRKLRLHGENIQSLDGLENFENGDFLAISTEKSRKYGIEKIADVPIRAIDLKYSRKADFDAIAKCRSLKKLTLNKSPSPDFSKWCNVPLDYLKLMQGSFEELSDTGDLKMLETLMLAGCRKHVRFSGDNSSVQSLTVYGCKLFDISSLRTFQGVGYVLIIDCAKEIALSDLPENSSIQYLNIQTSTIITDAYELEKKMPNLEVVAIQKLTKEQESILIKANPNIDFSRKWI